MASLLSDSFGDGRGSGDSFTPELDAELLRCCICSDVLCEPQLLGCLHSCCLRCCVESTAAAAHSPAHVNVRLKCGQCGCLSDFASLKRNSFLSARLQNSSAPAELPVCSPCAQLSGDSGPSGADGRSSQPVPAAHWCAACSMYMCDGCLTWHNKFHALHEVVPAAAAPAATGSAAASASSLCVAHGRRHEFLCVSCELLRCSDCVKSCMDLKHDLCDASSPRAKDVAGRLLTAVYEAVRLLAGHAEAARRCSELSYRLVAARSRDVARLKANKKRALDALAEAHHAATTERQALYAAATPRTAAAVQLLGRLRQAATYIRCLLDSNDALSTLDQHWLVGARLRALATEQAGQQPPSSSSLLSSGAAVTAASDGSGGDGSEQVTELHRSIEQLDRERLRWQRELDDALAEWIGRPRRQHSFGCISDLDIHSEESSTNEGQQPNFISATVLAAPQSFEQRAPEQPSFEVDDADHNSKRCLIFGDATDSFRAPLDCRDIAITADGRVLLAALKHGLKQYTVAGRKLQSWRPAKTERGQDSIVSTVDALDDGRVAVGIINLHCIVVLRRDVNGDPDGYGGFVEDTQIRLQMEPYRLSVIGTDLVAVAGASSVETKKPVGKGIVVGSSWSPGPRLALHSLATAAPVVAAAAGGASSSSDRLPSPHFDCLLEYSILSLVATRLAVVTLSNEKLPTVGGTDGSEPMAFLVEARTHHGEVIWRRSVSEDVYDVCSLPSGHVLYVALPYSLRVMAVGGDDGRMLRDVVAQATHTVLNPLRVSLARGRPARLALLSAKGVVVLYPVVGLS